MLLLLLDSGGGGHDYDLPGCFPGNHSFQWPWQKGVLRVLLMIYLCRLWSTSRWLWSTHRFCRKTHVHKKYRLGGDATYDLPKLFMLSTYHKTVLLVIYLPVLPAEWARPREIIGSEVACQKKGQVDHKHRPLFWGLFLVDLVEGREIPPFLPAEQAMYR